MNRERSNVLGYGTALTVDLGQVTSGIRTPGWPVRTFASTLTALFRGQEKVVFVTPWQRQLATVFYATADGYQLLVVPEAIANAIGPSQTSTASPCSTWVWSSRSSTRASTSSFVPPEGLTPEETEVSSLLPPLTELAELDLGRVGARDVLVPENDTVIEFWCRVLGCPGTR